MSPKNLAHSSKRDNFCGAEGRFLIASVDVNLVSCLNMFCLLLPLL